MKMKLSGVVVWLLLTGWPCLSRAIPAFLEDFEQGSKGTYTSNSVVCTAGPWLMDNFLIGTSTNDQRNGIKSVRGFGTLEMEFDKADGIGSVTLWHGIYGSDKGDDVSWLLEVSHDGGETWSAYQSAPQSSSATWQQQSFSDINVAGNVRLRIVVSGGRQRDKRLNFDDIAISDHFGAALMLGPERPEPFETRLGLPSAPQLLTIAGVLLEDSEVVVTAPEGFEVGTSSSGNYSASLTLPVVDQALPATDIYLRLKGSTIGPYEGVICFTSSGAATQRRSLSGSVVANMLPQLTGLPAATNVAYGSELTLEMVASDPDGTIVSLTAASETLPGASSLLSSSQQGNTTTATWCWEARLEGRHLVSFTATDNDAATVTATVVIEVAPDSAIAIHPGATVREGFDSLDTTKDALLPVGWRTLSIATVRTLASFGEGFDQTTEVGGNKLATNAKHGVYNFGAGAKESATDRAVGFLGSGSGTKSGALMVRLVNSGQTAIPGLQLAYNIEKYRCGSNPGGYYIDLFTSSDGATWTNAGTSFRREFAADTDNSGYAEAPGVTVAVAGELATLKIVPGASCYLLWSYSIISGSNYSNAQALALDNIVIKALAPPQTVLILR